MARLLPLGRPATVLDPACGDGSLLLSAAQEFGTDLEFVGIDNDRKALDRCREAMGVLGVSPALFRADFIAFDASRVPTNGGDLYVLMNPPFKGYGHLSRRRRKQILGFVPTLEGRFNLSHAFLKKAITDLRPKSVVALLPGNWRNAAYNDLRWLLGTSGASWRTLPESTFDQAATTTGILASRILDQERSYPETGRKSKETPEPLIRQGVATGADRVFIDIAQLRPESGRVVPAIRGRDVANHHPLAQLPRAWIPPKRATHALSTFLRDLSRQQKERLADRFCVKVLKRPLWSFHESLPRWFLGAPKIVVPEICTRMSVFADFQGKVLPLHSTIAIRAKTRAQARGASSLLLEKDTWRRLRNSCPHMVNGALRLTVPTLRQVLADIPE